MKLTIFYTLFLSLIVGACNTDTTRDQAISSDPAVIARGETQFNQYCGGCHNFKQDGIGPNLSGITRVASFDWIKSFISHPKKLIDEGDERAKTLTDKYKAIMPSFAHLPPREIESIIAYLNTHQEASTAGVPADSSVIQNPIYERIPLSDIIVNLQRFTRIPSSGKMPLTRITKLDFERGSGVSYVVDLRGKLYRLNGNAPALYMDMAALRPQFIDEPRLATGFGSFSFHPEFIYNGLIYTIHTEKAGSAPADFKYADSIKVALQCVITEWKADNPAAHTFSGMGRELLRVNMVTGMHGIQEIAFNPLAKKGDQDFGLLYICVGDGGSVEEGYPFLAHDKNKVWGTVLRIDPKGRNSDNRKYGIPPTNPFAKDQRKTAVREIFAYGFRNPHRISWTSKGEILVANIGQAHIESINLVRGGDDFGWPIREGRFRIDARGDLNKLFPLPQDDSLYNISYPVAQYDHDDGIAISGGFEYRGDAIPALKGKYLFGDIVSGRLLYFNVRDMKPGNPAPIMECKIRIDQKNTSLLNVCGSDRVDLHLGQDAAGELYILTKADGQIYKLQPATQ